MRPSQGTIKAAALTHYDVLKVSREASMEEIKASFRRLALETHPDKNPKEVGSNYQRIQQAWECLRDSRKKYDEELHRSENLIKSKLASAIALKLSDMEEAKDEDSNDIVYVFPCRCGDYIEVLHEDLLKSTDSLFLTECPGCSFSYSIAQ